MQKGQNHLIMHLNDCSKCRTNPPEIKVSRKQTAMMAIAIMPALDDLKSRIVNTNQKLTSQYGMMQMAHHRYNLLFKNYLTIQVGTLQRIHH